MRVAVVTFPGSNCDADTVSVAHHLMGATTHLVWHKEAELPPGADLVILPGGFSYGDALRSGAIAQFSPIMAAIRRFSEAGGLILGICNGFQILVEAGLLPGAMLQNASQRFVCRMVRVEVSSTQTPFTRKYQTQEILNIPVAHHEGRYHVDEQTMKDLEAQDRIVFRYLSEDNPNGSSGHVAGVLGINRNVLGMMPHPERAAEVMLGSIDGLRLFDSVKSWCHQAGGQST